MAQRWHKFDCKMMLGQDSNNESMSKLQEKLMYLGLFCCSEVFGIMTNFGQIISAIYKKFVIFVTASVNVTSETTL